MKLSTVSTPLSCVMHDANKAFYNNENNKSLGFITPETVDCIRNKIVDKLKLLINQQLHNHSNVCLIQFGFGNGYLIQDLLNSYRSNSMVKIIGVDYTDDKARLIKKGVSNFEFHKCDVEDSDQLSAFINHYNKTKPNNVFTIVLMLELIDDLTTTFYKYSDNGNIHELYCNQYRNQKPLFKQIADSIGLVLGNDLLSSETCHHYFWHKLTFEDMPVTHTQDLEFHLRNVGINSKFFMPFHINTRQIFKSLSGISSPQCLIIIDYFKFLSDTSPVRVYPQCKSNSTLNGVLLLSFVFGIVSTFDSFNKGYVFTGMLKFGVLVAFYRLFKQIDDSFTRGQSANPNLGFNRHPIFYKYSEQQLTSSVNEAQIKTELEETGYSTEACGELGSRLNIEHPIFFGNDFKWLELSK
jgi:SAM-dependent MidA family methyltransferase